MTKLALEQALPSRKLVFFAVAISERTFSWYSSSIGRGQTSSPVILPAAMNASRSFSSAVNMPGAAMAERHDDRAGQRGEFEDGGGLVGEARVGDGVGEDDAALGVGVEHLDGLAVARGDDVAGAIGVGPGHVFGGGDEADEVERQLQVGGGEHHAEHGEAAHLVPFHFVHLPRRA